MNDHDRLAVQVRLLLRYTAQYPESGTLTLNSKQCRAFIDWLDEIVEWVPDNEPRKLIMVSEP